MKCRRCGFENVDNADFCCHCGEDGMAVASMVCGICALLMMCCVPYFTLVMAILGLVFGILSLKKKPGNGMALTGVITSGISLAFSVIGILMGLSLLLNV